MGPRLSHQMTAAPASFVTRGGIQVTRITEPLEYEGATLPLAGSLDTHKGVLLGSNFEYPGRYTRWDVGFDMPPIELSSVGRDMEITAENDRGRLLLRSIAGALHGHDAVEDISIAADRVKLRIAAPDRFFAEEMRSKRPSVFSILRCLIEHFAVAGADRLLGFYGAFAYSLAYQFEPVHQRQFAGPGQRDLVLYLPDYLIVVDHYARTAARVSYEFEIDEHSTAGLERTGAALPYVPAVATIRRSDHAPGEYADTVRSAIEAFRAGDLFEVVPGQTFYEPVRVPPSILYKRLYRQNPAPYSFLINLGQTEYLIGASPEMYVRVDGLRVETAPISGTIKRINDAIGDSNQIVELLSSRKEESELTMCTDVDRNDKSRICVPGSVQVIGRRQIEMYSRVIHTVDHVEGTLHEGYDAVDAFLSHAWAVTVTGAPKKWAMQFIEDHEKSPRCWYGGAIGCFGFDGSMNTGLTLRTIHVKDGVGAVRAGATLLFDSNPENEELETRLKAEAFLKAISGDEPPLATHATVLKPVGRGQSLLFVDHEDSFVHTLANYFRQTGAVVVTWRAGFQPAEIDSVAPDIVVLSPGPGEPKDFGMSEVIGHCARAGIPIFGICLGLQGIVEHYGGSLARLDYPMHGKASKIHVTGGRIFAGLPTTFQVGRYHSLHADPTTMPSCLEVTARTEDGVVMAIEHRSLPIAAVQFHPESILTLEGDIGRKLVFNAVVMLSRTRRVRSVVTQI